MNRVMFLHLILSSSGLPVLRIITRYVDRTLGLAPAPFKPLLDEQALEGAPTGAPAGASELRSSGLP